jgi:hypothetical protein
VSVAPSTAFRNPKKEVLMMGLLMMRVSVVILLIGLVGGIAMGIAQEFRLAAAHAHLNFIGGVLLFLSTTASFRTPAPALLPRSKARST